MSDTFPILGIIPARGGSKGIPGKNLVDVNGLPLIGYSIRTGLELLENGCLSRCIVSTDSEKIAETARSLGAEVPFLRPDELASDEAKASLYVEHALDELERLEGGANYEAILILQPTSPIRDAVAIHEAAKEFMDLEAESLISCYEEVYINDLVMYLRDGENYLRPKLDDHSAGSRRQDHGGVMVRNGCVYLVRTEFFRRTGRLIADRPLLLEMSRSDSINVDCPEDLELLRLLLCKSES